MRSSSGSSSLNRPISKLKERGDGERREGRGKQDGEIEG